MEGRDTSAVDPGELLLEYRTPRMKRLNPLDHPLGWSLPHRTAASRWTCNVPFAMTLVPAVRPRSIVEIGTTSGVSYCSCCQAVDSAGTRTRCYAIQPDGV